MNGDDWERLLSRCPQFISKCRDWTKLSITNWQELLSLYPDLVKKFEAVKKDWATVQEQAHRGRIGRGSYERMMSAEEFFRDA